VTSLNALAILHEAFSAFFANRHTDTHMKALLYYFCCTGFTTTEHYKTWYNHGVQRCLYPWNILHKC